MRINQTVHQPTTKLKIDSTKYRIIYYSYHLKRLIYGAPIPTLKDTRKIHVIYYNILAKMFEEYKLMSTLTYVKLLLTTLLRISSITYEIQNQNGVQPVNKMHIPPKNFH